jgi:hypothetical protein
MRAKSVLRVNWRHFIGPWNVGLVEELLVWELTPDQGVQSLMDRGALGSSGTDRMRKICNFRMSEVIQQVSRGDSGCTHAELIWSIPRILTERHHDHGCILPKNSLKVDLRHGTVDCL